MELANRPNHDQDCPGVRRWLHCGVKPSEVAPLSAIIGTEILHAASVPKGVYTMVQGESAVVGEALLAYPGVDLMSFTGSTRAGILVAQNAAKAVKRVARELGGKSANILAS